MDEYRLLNKKLKKEQKPPTYKKMIFSILNKILICAVLFLLALIASKNKTYKDYIYKYVYSYNLSFAEIEQLYQKYFGSMIPTKSKKNPTEMVSAEKFSYDSLEEIENGVTVKVGKQASIPALESGLVIFKGEKEGYGTTIVLEQIDGTEAWYVGVDSDLELYDYIEKSSILGMSIEEKISLYFKKKGESVDYKNYLF